MHYAVMPQESLELLAIRPDGIYLDATTGLGGHTGLIAQRLTTGMVIANDRDAQSLEMSRAHTAEWAERIRHHHGPFSQLAQAVAKEGFERLDGVLADLGVSRYQLTSPERGFSFQSDGPLDMRMDQTTGMTAADLVNYTAEKALADLIFQLGEERRARRIVRAIVRARPIRSTLHLADVVERAVPRTGRTHPATRTFMALRMAVNEEQAELDRLLQIGPELLRSGGRMVVLSFMSTDDRKVKEKFKELARDGRATILTKHPLQPSDEEIAQNAASRSAKLRGLQMN
ncbi:S-adenosyl-dependent methyltransferase activity on membrane-located substrates [Candidatus Sulfopaludibacter sp. SbA3]|nr:S-adenosyl-dependent methyltransferase activity on membrane-located substrates [Candidatus Sulfopaludibacter sp. SbA3]